ncbi:MAG: hypothetical protein ACOH1H_11960 [Brevundimonas sp.]
MPEQAVPIVIGIIAFFAAFIIAVGWAALYTALPPHRDAPPRR